MKTIVGYRVKTNGDLYLEPCINTKCVNASCYHGHTVIGKTKIIDLTNAKIILEEWRGHGMGGYLVRVVKATKKDFVVDVERTCTYLVSLTVSAHSMDEAEKIARLQAAQINNESSQWTFTSSNHSVDRVYQK